MQNGNGKHLHHGLLNEALSLIPESVYVLTAAGEHARRGVLVHWVQRCSSNPPMVMIAMQIGQSVEPIILETRCFALCQLPADNCYLMRRFSGTKNTIDSQDDPFYATSSRNAPSGAPIIDNAISYLDCELVRHLDLESGYGIYIGLVKHGDVLNHDAPSIRIGVNGTSPAHDAETHGLNGKGTK